MFRDVLSFVWPFVYSSSTLAGPGGDGHEAQGQGQGKAAEEPTLGLGTLGARRRDQGLRFLIQIAMVHEAWSERCRGLVWGI